MILKGLELTGSFHNPGACKYYATAQVSHAGITAKIKLSAEATKDIEAIAYADAMKQMIKFGTENA